MNEVFPFDKSLPDEAGGAVAIVRTLAEAGHQALLAGGCVRDLLLGLVPQDYDVATDAPPDRVSAIFRATRRCSAPATCARAICAPIRPRTATWPARTAGPPN